MLRIPLLLISVLLFLFTPHFARGADRQEVLSFATALAGEGDHYRAITEYKRFLHLFPDDPEAAAVHLAIAESLVAGRRWDAAEKAAARIVEKFPGTPEAPRASLLHADIAFRRGDFAAARQRYRRQLEKTAAPEQRQLKHRLAWSYIEADRYLEAREVLSPVEDGPAGEFDAALANLGELPLKSPTLAGGLSAALPGAGQLYAERPRDAALAFLLNAAFLWGALDAFEDGNEAAGAILLFFEAGWYTGNIFNAVNSTQKYNRDLREEAKEPLRERFGLSLDRLQSEPTFGIAVRF